MHVVVHGHFYQPPRENPWTGVLPRQPSAAPSRDWNERICEQCYRPNGRSRVLGRGNRITDIVNNYAWMSFDFGPTLLAWLERQAPDVYRQVLEGDRLSVRLQGGHGNAIAHAYNHLILPLANYRDKRTQIAWGLRDFELRFGRRSESLWLAETAVNRETIRLLIEFGVRYIILSPHQALRARPLDRAAWADARGGRIEPTRPYRFFLKDSRRHRLPDRYIDIFFYDGALAAEVSFQHLLRSAPAFAERIARVGGGAPLVSVATDGEVYGHHEPFGDMCFSYLVRREAPARGFRIANYGRCLDLHPPSWEVDLDFGEQDEGTAWSCAHGVGRWERDCGCSTGAQPGWNQKWRTPLRRGLDMARDRLVECFLEQVSPLVQDPWATRDDYIEVLLDASPEAREAFLARHARRALDEAERVRLWSLLESQRYAMYMYTSCGWFFADVSGIETVQNLAYAARAIELASPWSNVDVEEALLEYLAEARSNVPEQGTGADVYRRCVEAQRVTAAQVAGDVALASAVLRREPEKRRFRHEVVALAWRRVERPASNHQAAHSDHARLVLIDRDTGELAGFDAHVYGGRLADFRCFIVPLSADHAAIGGARRGRAADSAPECAPPAEALGSPAEIPTPEEDAAAALPGVRRLALADLVAEGRDGIIRAAYETILERQNRALQTIHEESRGLLMTFRRAGVPVPPVLEAVARGALARTLEEMAQRLEVALLQQVQGSGEVRGEIDALLDEIGSLLGFSREAGLELPLEPLTQAFGSALLRLLDSLMRRPEASRAEQAVEVMRSTYALHFPLDRRPLEDLAYQVLKKHRTLLLGAAYEPEPAGDERRIRQAFASLAEALHLDIRRILEVDEGGSSAGETA